MCTIEKKISYKESKFREIDKICRNYILEVVNIINLFSKKYYNIDCSKLDEKIKKLNIKKYLYFKVRKEIEIKGIEYLLNLLYIYPMTLFNCSYKKNIYEVIINDIVIRIINHINIDLKVKK